MLLGGGGELPQNAHCTALLLGDKKVFVHTLASLGGEALLIGLGAPAEGVFPFGGAAPLQGGALLLCPDAAAGATAVVEGFAAEAAAVLPPGPIAHPRRFAAVSRDGLGVWAVQAAPGGGAERVAAARAAFGRGLLPVRGGRIIAVCGHPSGSVDLHSAASGRFVAKLAGHAHAVEAMAELPDSGYLATYGGDGTIRLWDVSQDLPEEDRGGGGGGADDDIAPAPFSFTVWNAEARTASAVLNVREGLLPFDGIPKRLAALANGLLACNVEKQVSLWDARSGARAAQLSRHTAPVTALVAFPDGTRLASGSLDATVIVWDVAALRPLAVLEGHAAGVSAIAVLASGRLASAAALSASPSPYGVAAGHPKCEAIRVWELCAPGSPEDAAAEARARALREAIAAKQALLPPAEAPPPPAEAPPPPRAASPARPPVCAAAPSLAEELAAARAELERERRAHGATRAQLEEQAAACALAQAKFAAEREARVAGAALRQPVNLFNVHQLVYHGPPPQVLTHPRAAADAKRRAALADPAVAELLRAAAAPRGPESAPLRFTPGLSAALEGAFPKPELPPAAAAPGGGGGNEKERELEAVFEQGARGFYAAVLTHVLSKESSHVVFLLDATASMTPWIHESRRAMLSKAYDAFETFQVSFVCYRDVMYGEQRFAEMPWGDANKGADALGEVAALAKGGNDWHEDVAGGLQKVRWRALLPALAAPNGR
jgi:hypothetical protein